MEKSKNDPVNVRSKIYRGLADICGNDQESKAFSDLATELEKADSNFREFSFRFNQVNTNQ